MLWFYNPHDGVAPRSAQDGRFVYSRFIFCFWPRHTLSNFQQEIRSVHEYTGRFKKVCVQDIEA